MSITTAVCSAPSIRSVSASISRSWPGVISGSPGGIQTAAASHPGVTSVQGNRRAARSPCSQNADDCCSRRASSGNEYGPQAGSAMNAVVITSVSAGRSSSVALRYPSPIRTCLQSSDLIAVAVRPMRTVMKLRALTSSLLLAVVLALTVAAPASANTNSTYRWRLFLEINQVRRDHGLRVLHIAPGLRTAAQNHSNDMVNRDYFAHTSPTGSTLYRRVVHSGFTTIGSWGAGENLAWGTGTYGSPRTTVRMWLASPEHRANLLSRSWGWVGIGRRSGRFLGHSGAVVWTVDFGHR